MNGRRNTPSSQRADDLRKLAEWWWDEAARCGEIDAVGLRKFAVSQAIKFTRQSEMTR